MAGGGGIRATNSVSITPRRYISTVSGGQSIAHTAYIGWTKPVRVENAQPGHANRQKTNLHATEICGNFKQPKNKPAEPARPEQTKPITLHLPKEIVIPGGTSLSKNSPSVIKLDRSFRHTFDLTDSTTLASTQSALSASGGVSSETPRRRLVPKYFATGETVNGHNIQPMMQTANGTQVQAMRNATETAWIGEEPPRISILASDVDSPRIQRLIDEHPKIQLDRRPVRLPCSLQHQPATLAPYKAGVLPYNPEFLWVHMDPEYKYRAFVSLSPRSKKLYPHIPVVPPLRLEKEWNNDNLSRTRDMYAKQMGNPKVLKLECKQNGLFDADLLSTDRAERLLRERRRSKQIGMEKLLQEGRREFAAHKVRSMCKFVFVLAKLPEAKVVKHNSGDA